MNIILIAILVLAANIADAAPSIRRPSMPQGVSATKTAFNEKPKEREPERVRTRKKRKGLTQKRKRLTLSQMNLEELEIAKDESMSKKHYDTALIYLERMVKLCENISKKAELIVELANLQFRQGKFADAKKQYQEFERLYPGNQLIEHAKRQIILCTKQTILSYDRDQAPTEETLELCQQYLDRDTFKLYRDEIESIKQECHNVLAQSECNVTDFYIKQGNFKSAQRRIDHIRSEWLEKVPAVQTTLAQLEVQLGTQWDAFEVPEASLKLVEGTAAVKNNKKVDMAARF